MENIFNSTEETNSTSIQPTLDPALLAQLRSGANWFYWIAGLSVVNSLIFAFGGKVSFIAGLGLTQIVDGIFDAIVTAGAPSAVRAVAIVISFVVIAMFALFGYYANKAITWVFILGIAIYALDAFLLLVLGAYFAAGFHAFALIYIIRGFIACRAVKQFNAQASVGAFGAQR